MIEEDRGAVRSKSEDERVGWFWQVSLGLQSVAVVIWWDVELVQVNSIDFGVSLLELRAGVLEGGAGVLRRTVVPSDPRLKMRRWVGWFWQVSSIDLQLITSSWILLLVETYQDGYHGNGLRKVFTSPHIKGIIT